MSTQIVMPQLGESVAEGVIGKWLKQEGDPIGKDEPIVEVVTDKVNAEIPSPVAGTLMKITAAEGVTVLVGEEIAVIGDGMDGDDTSETGNQEPAASVDPPASIPVNSDTSAEHKTTARAVAVSPAVTAPPDFSDSGGSRRVVRSSPLVQRLAAEHGVDISQVPGTGIGGRVSKKDILQFVSVSESHLGEAAPQAAPAPSFRPETELVQPSAPVPAERAQPDVNGQAPVEETTHLEFGPDGEYLPISPVRRMIAEHMVRSKFTIPHATTMIEIDMTRVVQFREAHKTEWQRSQGIGLSFMAFVAQAVVDGLKQYPLVNSEWTDERIILKKDVNLGLAVAAQNGLIVPNIKHADRLSLGGLAHAVNDLTVRARDGKLTPTDVAGGTFTLNNTGAIGSIWSISIINYPQAGIVSADAIVKRLRVMDDDSIAIRHIMNFSMSFDHRILDGSTVSNFMQHIRRHLEDWPSDAAL